MDKTRNKSGYQVELSEFRSHYTVHCPNCNDKTILTNKSAGFIEGKIICSKCGFNKKIEEATSYEISTVDGQIIGNKITATNAKALKLLLWYSANFKGNSFWALNEEHLTFVYEFINAKHRTRSQTDLKNRSIGSRLPKWITSASNREDLSKLIEGMLK